MQHDDAQQIQTDDQTVTFGDQQSFSPSMPTADDHSHDMSMPAAPPMPAMDDGFVSTQVTTELHPEQHHDFQQYSSPQVMNLNDDMSSGMQNIPMPQVASMPTASNPADELTSIKNEALHELSPLLGYLEQTPEEKFRTTMMLIQASDDQTLVKQAYESAKQITDQKIRAEALLDLVNEINYFTQNQNPAE